MKKILSLILVAMMLLVSLSACGGATSKVKVIDINLTEEEYAFGVDKTQPELLEKVNAFIKKIQEDGTFDEICNKYFGDGTPTPLSLLRLIPARISWSLQPTPLSSPLSTWMASPTSASTWRSLPCSPRSSARSWSS